MNQEATLKSYVIGFILSALLTVGAYAAVVLHFFSGIELVWIILAFALAQLTVQLLFFLYLGSGQRWKAAIFFSTVGLVLIIVVGSLWIMGHLNYRMMASPAEMQQYMQDQQGF